MAALSSWTQVMFGIAAVQDTTTQQYITGACCVICRKETVYDFCHGTLPDWQSALIPACGVRGYEKLQQAIRMAHDLPANRVIATSFNGEDPTDGAVLAQPST